MDFATATTQPAADSVESDCNPTQAGLGSAWQGTAGKAQTAAIERGISGSQTTNKNRK